jgi:2-oxoglutarate/2-oxoacid ferredoxin oxidoreductase subunit alpha
MIEGNGSVNGTLQGNGQPSAKPTEERETVVVRFCGDSGDGMQTAGGYFTTVSAIVGNDVSTLPDFPAEIRAPTGTLAGVSGFQVCFSSGEIMTPGDDVDTLIAMNPAALRTNLKDLKRGGILILDEDYFDKQELEKAGYKTNPLEDGSLVAYHVVKVPLTTLNRNALEGMEMSQKDVDRCRNSFALGLVYWLYQRPLEPTIRGFQEKFGKKNPKIVDANVKSINTGYFYGETTEAFAVNYRVPKAHPGLPGRYRQITGNEATAFGMVTAAKLSGKRLVYASYPITPASNVLHELAKHKEFDVVTLQMEDEIAAVGAAVGASFGGALGSTGTSGPGALLKAEGIALAVMTELPLVIIDVQRGGPSTGLPTKTEQADLLQAMFGRNSECPLAIVAPSTPSDCFTMIQEAYRLAVRYMTPVIFLSDGYIANGAEPWLIPDPAKLPRFDVNYLSESNNDDGGFLPYKRDSRLVRPWVKPGTPGLEHRIGGLEKQDVTGNISYDAHNHQHMVNTRAAKIAGIADDIPLQDVYGDEEGDLLVVGWGGTFGHLRMAVDDARRRGKKVSHMHLRYLNPMPKNIGDILKRFKKVVACELNLGQLRMLLRSMFLVDVQGLTKVAGQPFLVREVIHKIDELV